MPDALPVELVIDAGVPVNYAVSINPYHAQARQFFADAAREGWQLISPSFWEAEADTAIMRMESYGALNNAAAQKLLDATPIMVVYEPSARSVARRLAARIHQRKVYDSSYLALAQVRGCDIWTADQRLFNAAQTAGLDFVKFIGAYSSVSVGEADKST